MCRKRFKLCVLLIFLEQPNQQLPFVTPDIDSDDDLRPMLSEPLIHDDIRDAVSDEIQLTTPDPLPVLPSTATPVLPGPSKKEKQRRITNQEVLKLQAEVVQCQKEVLLLKKLKLELQIQSLKQ